MCIPIYERYQYIYWAKAKLCWASTQRYIDVRWSDKGPVEDMRCTQIKQQSGKYQTGGWENNYLCIRNAPYKWVNVYRMLRGLEDFCESEEESKKA